MNFDKHNSFDKIPQELRELDRWVCWRWEERFNKDGTPDAPAKMPINPTTGGRAMSNNPATWGTYEDAVNVALKGKIQDIDVCGIGFMFNGDGIIGVDIDHCMTETGGLEQQAIDIVSTLDSYTEYSQSRNGVHIICYGKLPEGGRRKSNVEMYSAGRYFIVTGDTLDDAHEGIEERTAELAVVHGKYINVKKTEKSVQKTVKNVQNMTESVSDDEVIEIALAAKNGNLFASLMDGNWKGSYSSASEADLALCNLLAFYTGRDAGMMDRLFRRSGLYREKWGENRPGGTYGSVTIDKAISDCNTVYQAPRPRREAGVLAEDPGIDMGLDQLVKDAPVSPVKDDVSSDMGRSKRFSEKFKGMLCWCGDFKSWMIWNGRCWQADKILRIIQMAKDTVEEMVKEVGKEVYNASGEEQITKAKQRFKEVVKGKSERSIKAMVDLAKSDLPVTADELNSSPFLLNCQNGVVDLRTGELLPHDPKYYMTKIAAADYIPGKKFEKYGQFLKDITCGDEELAEYFQQICGMSAVGKVFYEGMCMFYGGGRNGKSTFLNCISKVLGDYAGSINVEALMSQKDGRQVVGGVSVEGKRLVTAMEPEEGRRLSAAMLKKLASTDLVTERQLYKDERVFEPSHTLIMATNHLPKVGSTDAGTWRRIAVVPFKAVFDGKKEIKDYASVLFKADSDAILGWIIEGAMKYLKSGCNIKSPKAVESATSAYRADEDWLGNFVAECCENGEYEESGGRLYDAYVSWCEKNNESYKRRARDFASALEMAGYVKRKTMHGAVWDGLKLTVAESDLPVYDNWSKYRSKKGKGKENDEDGLDEQSRMKM